ncbi:hypothetical protein ACJMK2_016470 [Sinanodonta woodiana]|uniref:C2 domain-containing protein n=1 Tax=Sinanodonta woodiana TaxID=1069815 RepID=A0ABD3UTQ1_SINWO
MVFREENFKFDIDLLEATKRHLDFLKQVYVNPLLNNVNVLSRAIYRYEYYWLPLAVEHRGQVLTAPLDISWVWHCHMLCPKSYVKDCMSIVGVVIDHKFVDNEQRALERSKYLWLKKYQDTREPFEIDMNDCCSVERTDEISRISYDIEKAASRQALFYYSVSLPHYRDRKFLMNSLLRYKKFLYLRQENKEHFLVPSLLGQLFNHDDTSNDRTLYSKRTSAEFATNELWKNTFKETYLIYGTMHRGDSQRERLSKLEPSDVYKLSTKKTSIQLTECVLHKQPERYKHFKLNICCSRDTISGFAVMLRAKKDPLGKRLKKGRTTQISNQIVWREKDLKKLDISTRDVHYILVSLSDKFGTAGIGKVELDVGDVGIYNLLPLVEGLRKSSAITFETSLSLDHELRVSLKGTVAPPTCGAAILSLESDVYREAVIPEYMKHLCGPMKMAHLTTGTDDMCQIADHRLTNHTGQVIFTCRIAHNLPLLMSTIQVYHQDKTVAVAHLIEPDQLPLPTQVSKADKSVVLSPKSKERAVIIKNNAGDWGICVGRWAGFRKGIPVIAGRRGQQGRRGTRGLPGTLKVSFYKMSTRRWTHFFLGYLTGEINFRMESVQADLYRGSIEVNTDQNEVAENLALVFSVSLLHVLCIPRPTNWKVGECIVQKTQSLSPGLRAIDTIPSDNMSLILACGLHLNTPSNHYIQSQYNTCTCSVCGEVGKKLAGGNFCDVICELDHGSAQDGYDCCSCGNAGGDFGGDGRAIAGACGGCRGGGGCGSCRS